MQRLSDYFNNDDQKTSSEFEYISPTSLDNYDLSEKTPTDTPTETSTKTSNFDFSNLLAKYEFRIQEHRQFIAIINKEILTTTEMINFDVIKTAKLEAYNSLRDREMASMAECNIRIQNITNIQQLNQFDIDNLCTLHSHLGYVEDFLQIISLRYADILADEDFIQLMADTVNSVSNKKLIAQHIYQMHYQSYNSLALSKFLK